MHVGHSLRRRESTVVGLPYQWCAPTERPRASNLHVHCLHLLDVHQSGFNYHINYSPVKTEMSVYPQALIKLRRVSIQAPNNKAETNAL